MVNKLDGSSFDIVKNNIQKLKELFPEVVDGDNEIDFDNLRDIFKEYDENIVDDGEEHYKFTWWGKKEAKNNAKATTTKTLRPVKKDSKNWDTTNNIYIEGDNLDALKILLGSYRNKIKMIYIDPPYNTGNDFIYVDNYRETNKEHLKRTGQLNADGFLDENPVTDGKYHSKWLNMIYPRLLIARKLLTDDGVIFISCDDNEQENIRKLCNEIFGEDNFIANAIRRKNKLVMKGDKTFKNVLEPLVIYAKNKKKVTFGYTKKEKSLSDFSVISAGYGIKEVKFLPGQLRFRENNKIVPKNKFERLELLDDLEIENNLNKNTVRMCAEFKWSESKIHEKMDENAFILIKKTETMTPRIYFETDTAKPLDYIDESYGKVTNEDGKTDLVKLGLKDIFSYPKPVEFITFLENIISDDNCIILDFFSGSATTAHATLKINSEDTGKRKFIMIQLPELTYELDSKGNKVPKKESKNAFNEGYYNISEVGKERIRRAGDKILEESENKDLDIGFKVFKVDDSNFIPWNPNVDNVEQAILSTRDNLVAGRSELDLIYELLLKLNLDLNASIEEVTLDNGLKNKVYVIRNGFVLVCLDEELSDSIADDLLNLKKELKSTYTQVVLKDSALNDSDSINIYELLKSNNVRFYTI